MLLRASVVVCHGGAGVTFKAPAHGVPVCAVPFGRDQLKVARRLERTGAGTRLPGRRLNPRRLRAAMAAAERKTPRAREVGCALRAPLAGRPRRPTRWKPPWSPGRPRADRRSHRLSHHRAAWGAR